MAAKGHNEFWREAAENESQLFEWGRYKTVKEAAPYVPVDAWPLAVSRQVGLWTLVAVWIICGGAMAGRCAAGEPVEAFLQALRDRGWYEEAGAYLDQCRTSPIVSDEVKQAIAYHRAAIDLEWAEQTADAALRETRLEKAAAELGQFIKSAKSGDLVAAARTQLARVSVRRGRALVSQAERSEPKRQPLLEQARGRFDRGRQLLEASEKYYVETLKQFPKILDPRTEAVRIERRQKIRSELVSTRLLIGTAIREKGKSYPRASEPFKAQLTDAAKHFEQLYEKYRRWLGGLYGHLWQGRCYQDLGELDKAIGCYDDLLSQPVEEPAVRRLATKAGWFQAECLLEQGKFDRVIQQGTAWLDKVRGAEAREPDALALKYQIAMAHYRKEDAAKEASAEGRKHLREAQRLAREVSRSAGEFQEPARQLLLTLGAATRRGEPESFADALAVANEAFEVMGSAKMGLQLAARNNPEATPQLQDQYDESRRRALESFQLALRLVDDKTPLDQVNQARAAFGFLCWQEGRYYDAAVLGESLARRFPDQSAARQAALIALASYQKLLAEANPAAGQFAATRMESLADFVVEHWPDGREANEAMRILIGLAVRSGDMQRARQQITRLPPERRAASERKVGQAFWAEYLRGGRLDAAAQPAREVRDKLRGEARQLLESGLARLPPDAPVDAAVVMAVLSLAQLYLDEGESSRAAEILEDKRFGPLTLLSANEPAASAEQVARETCKAALRAYVSVDPPAYEKIERVMRLLEQRPGRAAGGTSGATIDAVYLGLARQLERRLEQLRLEGKTNARQQLVQAFAALLDRVARRDKAATWSTGHWLADAYFSLASHGQAAGKGSTRVEIFLQKAAAAYQAILAAADKDGSFAPSQAAVLEVMVRRAECLRELDRYREALDLLAATLQENQNLLEAQKVAAYTYQQRGERQDARWYVRAWKGGRADKQTGENRIWGWAKLAKIAMRHKQYRDVFFEARYNVALCRFRYALSHEPAAREADLRRAADDVRFTAQLFPSLGGQRWRGKYDRLRKDIQAELGKL